MGAKAAVRLLLSLAIIGPVSTALAEEQRSDLPEPEARPGGAALARRFLPPGFDDSAELTPLVLSVPRAPQPVRATDGRYHLVYELQMLNFGSFPATQPDKKTPPPALEVTEVALFANGGETPFLVLDGAALANRMQLVRMRTPPPPTAVLEGAQSGILFIDATFPTRQAVPKRIGHRVTVKAITGTVDQPLVDKTTLVVPVDQTPVVVIGPFLRGGPWLNFNGCCDFASPHRRIGRAVNGKEFWPERFAIDLLKGEAVDGELKVCTGDCGQVNEWFSTGEDILAVADGVVTRVVTGLDNNPIDQPPYPPFISTGGGNELLVYIGDGLFTMYGHLLKNTVSLSVGDRVRRGDVIGKLGNTGQSSAPHLHFQVMDDNSIAASEGLPWVFDRFLLVGTFEKIDDNGAVAGITPINSVRRGQLPLQQTLISFP